MNKFISGYEQWKVAHLSGRYIHLEHVEPLLDKLDDPFSVRILGKSVNEMPIYGVQFGQGKQRILMWSQMHGNESTTTKAVFDLFSYIKQHSDTEEIADILKKCQFLIIPILNPDGAKLYTRHNAADIDLNRDILQQTQVESKVLRTVFTDFKPDFCFNLHGQRSIYGIQTTGKPSILSFLAPAADDERSLTLSRKRAMGLISTMYKALKVDLSGCIGRYDDAYNVNCAGDYFQTTDVPTILVEAGHYPEDYPREITRKYVLYALLKGIEAISKESLTDFETYLSIPEHQSCYYDVLIKNVALQSSKHIVQIAIQFQEVLENDTIVFIPKAEKIIEETAVYGHRTIDANFHQVSTLDGQSIIEGMQVPGISLSDGSTITL